jgi:hypothetical protein
MNARQVRLAITIVTALLALVLAPTAVRAETIDFTLTQSSQTGSPGQTLMFEGALSNPNSSTVFLNNDSFTIQPSFLSLDDSPFFANTPLSLAPNGSAGSSVGPVDLFNVDIGASATPGTYTLNVFNVLGGADGSAQDVLATAQFTVIVQNAVAPAPEPGSLPLLGSGLGMLGVSLLRRRRKTV